MISTITRTLLIVGAALASAPLLSACSSETNGEVTDTGRLTLNLTGVSASGTVYRLRNATFDVMGATPPAPTTTLFSETNPDASVLSVDLPPGAYTSTLSNDWFLERLDGMSFVAVDATLVSANPVMFDIAGGIDTNIAYQFSTQGIIITLGDGTLNIGIEVLEGSSMPGGECTFFGTDCPPAQTCTPVSTTAGVCAPPGSIPFGAPCTANIPGECVANGVCGDIGMGMVCIEMCDVAMPACSLPGATCADLGAGTLFGVCL